MESNDCNVLTRYVYAAAAAATGMCVRATGVCPCACNRYDTSAGNGPHRRSHARALAVAGHRRAAAADTHTRAHCVYIRVPLSPYTIYNNIIYASGRLVKRVRRYIPVFGWLFFFPFFFSSLFFYFIFFFISLLFLSAAAEQAHTHTHARDHRRFVGGGGYGRWRSF
ncbi:unnamed protein product [Aphis gossypii]|uniref:Uncharacterized protein n=1 Tax=Aphis gossypii TaxID=80765 RepID=A0A9P0JC80_APHGO|nr:unnamed protein product [Aphis gossypii]